MHRCRSVHAVHATPHAGVHAWCCHVTSFLAPSHLTSHAHGLMCYYYMMVQLKKRRGLILTCSHAFTRPPLCHVTTFIWAEDNTRDADNNTHTHTPSCWVSWAKLTLCITVACIIFTALLVLNAISVAATQPASLEGFSTSTFTWVFCCIQT